MSVLYIQVWLFLFKLSLLLDHAPWRWCRVFHHDISSDDGIVVVCEHCILENYWTIETNFNSKTVFNWVQSKVYLLQITSALFNKLHEISVLCVTLHGFLKSINLENPCGKWTESKCCITVAENTEHKVEKHLQNYRLLSRINTIPSFDCVVFPCIVCL